MSTHFERVLDIASAVSARGDDDGFASLEKSSVSHFVPNPHDPRHTDRKIDVTSLDHILAIDVAARRCVAEPGVTFSKLVKATLTHGLAPRMVPELETITIGGAVAGCAIESMAFRHGGFHDSCVEYEVITAYGDVVRCSREHDTELFEMMHGSYGTLGILTELTFELVPAAPFVRMEYRTCDTWRAFRASMKEATEDASVDFIDAIAHARDVIVLCIGRFTHEAPIVSSYRGTEIYYRSTLTKREDWLRTYDYFFRFDTDCHWASQTLPLMGTRWGRRLFGRFVLGSTNLLSWSERLRPLFKLQKRPPVVTDLFIPDERVDEFHDWYERDVGFYPLWIVPYRMNQRYPWLRADHASSGMYLDFAIYGLPDSDMSEVLERKAFELNGIKTLIGQNHYDERTFFQIYDRHRYARIKRRMDPKNLFRTVYEKMVTSASGAAVARAPSDTRAPHPTQAR
jgi:FAD/FMN-containing dehydrogenase